jgi:HAD superfamily hydrolase (TIGR01509 family)
MTLRAVIFDKDGVLIDSERGKCVAMRRALTGLGYNNIKGFEEWFFSRVGMSGLESSEYCVRYFKLDGIEPFALYDKTEEIRREMIENEPAPIIENSVAFLRKIPKGIKIGVASSDFSDNIRIQMKQAGVLERIDAMTSGEISSGEVKRDKPHPDVYLVTARKLGVEPRNCIGIEDTALGIKAVKTAGMYCIGYKNPNSGKQNYSWADYATDNLQDVSIGEFSGKV